MKKQTLMTIGGLILLVVIAVTLFNNINSEAPVSPNFNIKTETPSTTNISKEPIVDNTTINQDPSEQIVVESTGGLAKPITQSEAISADQFKNLRLRLPVDTEYFSMAKFNFSTFKITVTFKSNFSGDKNQELNNWLSSNGFGNVDKKYFEIK